jgi:O-antigen ligase
MLQLMAESASRTSFLTFVLGFMTVIVLFKTKNSWGKIAIFAAGAVVFFLVFQFLMQSEVLKNRILQSTQEGDFSDRDMIWQRLVPVIKNNPIIGVGITGYAQVAQSIFGRAMSPHNVILEILCFTGITGLFIYLVFLYRIFKKSLNHYRLDGFLLPMILTIPILAMLLTGQILNVKIGWVIFAYIATSTSIINTQEPD